MNSLKLKKNIFKKILCLIPLPFLLNFPLNAELKIKFEDPDSLVETILDEASKTMGKQVGAKKVNWSWCGENSSSYDPLRNFICLGDELENKDLALAFTTAHEYAHHIQKTIYGSLDRERMNILKIELQADCLAGYFIQKGNEELGVTRESILEMASAAYAIGSDSHGTGAQRAYALLSGMGRVDSTCSMASIDKLVENEIDDPLYKTFSKTRGSGKSVDLEPTPYKKDAAGLLGVNLKGLSNKTKFEF